MARLIVNPTAANRKEISLSRSTLLAIGRDPSNDLVLPDAMVSRRHAVVEWRGSQFFLRDCNSSNGSVVNGDRISEKSLRDGDLVAIGTARLLFRDDLSEPGAKVVQHPSAARFQCPSCHAEYRKGDLFCRECGGKLASASGPPKAICASCGSAVVLPARFCNACGSALAHDGEKVDALLPVEADKADAGPPPALPPLRSDEPATGPPTPAPVLAAPPDARPAGIIAAAPALPIAAMPAPPAPALSGARPPADEGKTTPAPLERGRSDRLRAVKPGESSGVAARSRAVTPRPPAPFGVRLVAGLLDLLLVGAAQALVLAPVVYYWWGRALPESPSDVSFVSILLSVLLLPVAGALGAAYYVYFWGARGATPGQRFFDLRVETEDGGCPIGPGKAGLRFVGYLLSAASLGVGFLMIAFTGSGLHDRIAGTRVVRGRPA